MFTLESFHIVNCWLFFTGQETHIILTSLFENKVALIQTVICLHTAARCGPRLAINTNNKRTLHWGLKLTVSMSFSSFYMTPYTNANGASLFTCYLCRCWNLTECPTAGPSGQYRTPALVRIQDHVLPAHHQWSDTLNDGSVAQQKLTFSIAGTFRNRREFNLNKTEKCNFK